MPLTKTGKKVLRSMQAQYGKDKGEMVFYSSINKENPGSKEWHKKSKKHKIGRK